MLSHVHIGVRDLDVACAFYGPLFDLLGLARKFREDERGWAGWMEPGKPRPLIIVGTPFDGAPAAAGNGQMVAFLARDRATVDACYRTAMAQGAQSEGEPGLRPEYHEQYYGAYFRDPDGNKLCICCHEPA